MVEPTCSKKQAPKTYSAEYGVSRLSAAFASYSKQQPVYTVYSKNPLKVLIPDTKPVSMWR
jgi:hypothetical protein